MTDHVVALNYSPRKWQAEIHRQLGKKRFAVIICHRRAGKSVAAKMELIHRALERPRFEGGYIAPFLSQARRVMWGQLKDLAQMIPNAEIRETEMLITFPNKSTIRCLGADSADGIRGLGFDYVVGDEMADWDPEVLPQVVLPTLAGRNGGLCLIGTPKGVDTLSITYLKNKDDPEWYAVKMSVYDTGAIPEKEIELQKGLMAPSIFALEYECDFSQGSSNSLITVEEVQSSFGRSLSDFDVTEHPVILGVDVARYGDDSTVIFKRQGQKTWAPTILRGANTIEIARKVCELYHRDSVDGVFIDYSAGMGGGVEDQLVSMGIHPICVHFNGKPQNDRFLNCRAEMWFNMCQWIRGGGALVRDGQLLQELTTITYQMKESHKIQLESKDDMKKRGLDSPDRADALALTFYCPVTKRHRSTPQPATDWDPWRDV